MKNLHYDKVGIIATLFCIPALSLVHDSAFSNARNSVARNTVFVTALQAKTIGTIASHLKQDTQRELIITKDDHYQFIAVCMTNPGIGMGHPSIPVFINKDGRIQGENDKTYTYDEFVKHIQELNKGKGGGPSKDGL